MFIIEVMIMKGTTVSYYSLKQKKNLYTIKTVYKQNERKQKERKVLIAFMPLPFFFP